jgi:NitT/TauT family transport system ATP-binding protein
VTYSQSVTSGATESGAEPVLSVRSLRKAYNVGRPTEKLAIGDVSFDVAKGEFVCVVGPSGAGKTTMLRCLSGLLPPTTGEVRFEGRKLQAVPDRLSVVFQDYSRSLFPWLTVNRNVAVPLKVAGVARKEREARIQEVLHADGGHFVSPCSRDRLYSGVEIRVGGEA